MYRVLFTFIALFFLLSIPVSQVSADVDRERFGEDPRHERAATIDFEVSDQYFEWDMVMPWSRGLLFYDMAQHFADSVRLASAGRLDINVYAAGELVPAMESFDAVSAGSAEVGHDWPGYWKGKDEAFVAFASVPFGLDAEGYNVWLYEMGGLEMMQDLYGEYNLKAFPGGNAGQELGLYSNVRATSMEDYEGLRVRTPGWYMDILTELGASVSPLPGGEIYLALERGVIDAAEFSTPAINYPMGFERITDYIIMPGVHQPSVQCGIFINQDAWEELPQDLQEIVELATKETQFWSNTWQEYLNAQAIHRIGENAEYVKMDKEARAAFAKQSRDYLQRLGEEHPRTGEILESQEEFKEMFAKWRDLRSGVEPYPFDMYIEGKMGDH